MLRTIILSLLFILFWIVFGLAIAKATTTSPSEEVSSSKKIENMISEEKISPPYFDSYVPQDVKYTCNTCKSEKVKGTNLEYLNTIQTKRFPIEIEIPYNWYNTQ